MEILGLIDSLEAMVLDGFKIPFSKKTLVNEDQVLALIDKIRLVAQGGGGIVRKTVGGAAPVKAGQPLPKSEPQAQPQEVEPVKTVSIDDKSNEILQQAYQMAREIREGADGYADEVLENLEATTSRIIRTIKAGRERLSKEKVNEA